LLISLSRQDCYYECYISGQEFAHILFALFSAPVGSGRETGFLIPAVGNSSDKGIRFSPTFFWAIDENKDATFTADYYSKRGIGEGVEYRFVDFNHEGTWHVYHMGDDVLHKDYIEVKGTERYSVGNVKAFVDVQLYKTIKHSVRNTPKDFQSSISRSPAIYRRGVSPPLTTRGYISKPVLGKPADRLPEHVPSKNA